MALRRETVALTRLRRDGNTWARTALDAELVAQLKIHLLRGQLIFDVRAYEDEIGTLWLADGFHQVAAAQAAGRTEIPVCIAPGSAAQAFEFSLRAATPPHPLTRPEQELAARRLLTDPIWRLRVPAWVARQCRLSLIEVEAIQRSLTAAPPAVETAVVAPAPVAPDSLPLPARPRGRGRPERQLTVNGETHTLRVWAQRYGLTTLVLRNRVIRGEPLDQIFRPVPPSLRRAKAGTAAPALLNRTTNEQIRDPQQKLRRVSPRAKLLLKGTRFYTHRLTLTALAWKVPSLQCLIADRLRKGQSNSVEEALTALKGGAPIDAWSQAYAAITALGRDDQVRLARLILGPEGSHAA